MGTPNQLDAGTRTYLMDEHFLATIVGRDEAPSLQNVEPLTDAAFERFRGRRFGVGSRFGFS